MESAGNYFDAWLKSQEKLLEGWTESVKKVQSAYLRSDRLGSAATSELGRLFEKAYNIWVYSMAYSIPKSKDYPMGILRESLLKSANGSNVYVKLYEAWLPLFQALQEKSVDIDSYKEFLDPVKCKEVTDQLMGFCPDAMTEFFEQSSRLMDSWNISTKEFVSPWVEAVENNFRGMPQFMQGHPDSIMNAFHNAFESYDRTFGRFLHVHAVGKDREKVELMLRSLDDLTVYMTKYIKYQQIMYVTSLKATERFIEVVAQKIKNDEIKSFNEIPDLWMDITEKKYLEVGRTAEFSRIQGELMNVSLIVRSHYFKLMELYLFDVPVALRSEMDDLYKTIYELKKKVKGLERQVTELSPREAAA